MSVIFCLLPSYSIVILGVSRSSGEQLYHSAPYWLYAIDRVYACYVAAKATYIRLLHGKIGILEGFLGPSSVHMGRTHIVLG